MTDTRFRPTNAMILAAGLGKRMRPLTATTPKPLIEVNGQALIDHGMDRLAASGVRKCVVNVHYLADLVEVHVRRRQDMDIVISDERAQLLETGGGIKNALPLLGSDPFFQLNSDTCYWVEGVKPNLEHMIDAWDDSRMDALLMLVPVERARAAGVETRLEIWDEMVHVFHMFHFMMPEAAEANRRIGEFFRIKWGVEAASAAE
mgnify:CR=1 FL=1